MIKRVAALVLFALVFALPAAAQDLAGVDIPYERHVLDNGLTVVVHEDRKAPIVAVSIWYHVGSKNEPQGKTGFAHLFEHLMFMGTERVPGNQFDVLMETGGGANNASTSTDRTNYYEQVPAQYLEAMLWTHRERMAFPVVDQEVFDREREVVKEELRQRVLAPPYGSFQRFVLGHWGKNSGQARGEHGFAGSGRAAEQQVVRPGCGDFQGAARPRAERADRRVPPVQTSR